MKKTFEEALREILKAKDLHKIIKRKKESLTVIENYTDWNCGAKYYREILVDPICGVVFYNKQLGDYAEGKETDDCVSKIIYEKKVVRKIGGYEYIEIDDENDWGKGTYVVGKGLPEEHIKRITGIEEPTVMEGITTSSRYRHTPLSEIFEVEGDELLRALKISLEDLLEKGKPNEL